MTSAMVNVTSRPQVFYPPDPTGDKFNSVHYVVLYPGERVDWHWQHDEGGSHIVGYSIDSSKRRNHKCSDFVE